MEVPEVAETAADDLLVHWATSDLLSETTVEHGLMEQEKIAKVKPEEAVDYIWKGTAVADEIPYAKRRTVGEMVKNVVLNAPPLVASNITARAASFRRRLYTYLFMAVTPLLAGILILTVAVGGRAIGSMGAKRTRS